VPPSKLTVLLNRPSDKSTVSESFPASVFTRTFPATDANGTSTVCRSPLTVAPGSFRDSQNAVRVADLEFAGRRVGLDRERIVLPAAGDVLNHQVAAHQRDLRREVLHGQHDVVAVRTAGIGNDEPVATTMNEPPSGTATPLTLNGAVTVTVSAASLLTITNELPLAGV